MHSLVQPDAWVGLKLPSGNLRILQIIPNTTISLGKYGAFPSNLIIQRPYHLTYELLDKQPPENFNRLRIVPASELYADILTSSSSITTSNTPGSSTPLPDADADVDVDAEGAEPTLPSGIEYSLVDADSGAVVSTTSRAAISALASSSSARQTLSMQEIEALKRDATDAGKDLITKLMLSHTAIDEKTEYSKAKYKLLKTRKYIRRFSVLPLDVGLLAQWQLEEKDASKVLDMREEMLGLLGCWANVHHGGEGEGVGEGGEEDQEETEKATQEGGQQQESQPLRTPGRWLVVDDIGGLLVAAMAERMGILYEPEAEQREEETKEPSPTLARRRESITRSSTTSGVQIKLETGVNEPAQDGITTTHTEDHTRPLSPTLSKTAKRSRGNDLAVPYATSNTLTVVHSNSQPNLSFLRYYNFDIASPTQSSTHPLCKHLMTLSWLQLLEPESDNTYATTPPSATPEELRSWKSNKRGTYHRKRRRWAKIRHIVDGTRQGGFSGLVIASTMDPISIMRHLVPLLAGGAPIAIYSQSIEPLTALADCYSIARRGAWVSTPPAEAIGKTAEELETWSGTEEFPLNPSLVLGASLQTSRVRKWQVLPGRTHPMMTSKGGAEGYVFTAWRVRPAEGKVEARGKARPKKRKVGDGDQTAMQTDLPPASEA
ncbi:Gcd10p family-domain-containing protein [Xylariaceae sp. FL0016]|nr:Gcd10p family-domain-containing protein [Xylariaceae sp. FL0016]